MDSVEGKGSTFWFTAAFDLPATDRRQGDSAGARYKTQPSLEKTAKILLAEDNPVNQFVALAQLKRLGFAAHAVSNGAEAIEALQRDDYDLVLMDCEMPVMDGFEAARRIRASVGSAIPIVALTANAMREDRENALRRGWTITSRNRST